MTSILADERVCVPPDAPVAPGQRYASLDILRGFAVMAIFLVNIKGMVMPFSFYMNGSLWTTELDQHIAVVQKFLVDDRWRTIFTAMFGAGLVLISEKSVASGAASGAGRVLRRNFWLLVFGAIHMLLIWQGDILFLYAMAGFIAIWFRNMRGAKLVIWAIIILTLGTAWAGFMAMAPAFKPSLAAELGADFWGTDPAALKDQVAIALGPVSGQISARLGDAVGYVVFFMLLGGNLMVTVGLMLWGMVLYRSGFLRATGPIWMYLVIAVVGLGAASAIEWVQLGAIKQSGYDFVMASKVSPLGIIDGFLGALGFSALIMAAVAAGITFGPVASVGRMAFTNYILCSLIGTTLGAGHGLGWFGSASLVQLMAVCVATFIGMLIWSPLWLRVFRFGPLEWLWRSLTYGRLQPIRR